MSFLTWVFVGLICGVAASVIFRLSEEKNMGREIVLGLVGAFAAGIFVTPYFGIETINQRSFGYPNMFVSLGGAVVVLVLFFVLRKVGARSA